MKYIHTYGFVFAVLLISISRLQSAASDSKHGNSTVSKEYLSDLGLPPAFTTTVSTKLGEIIRDEQQSLDNRAKAKLALGIIHCAQGPYLRNLIEAVTLFNSVIDDQHVDLRLRKEAVEWRDFNVKQYILAQPKAPIDHESIKAEVKLILGKIYEESPNATNYPYAKAFNLYGTVSSNTELETVLCHRATRSKNLIFKEHNTQIVDEINAMIREGSSAAAEKK